MARVIALIPDLMFGSRVQSAVTQAGHEIELAATRNAAEERLRGADVLIVDLTDERIGGPELVEALRREEGSGQEAMAGAGGEAPSGRPCPPRTLGFYSHVDVATRERALRAGFDLVVPRSRMAREGAALVTRLAAGG